MSHLSGKASWIAQVSSAYFPLEVVLNAAVNTISDRIGARNLYELNSMSLTNQSSASLRSTAQ